MVSNTMLLELDLKNYTEYWQYIISQFISGQVKDSIEKIEAMSKRQRSKLLDYLDTLDMSVTIEELKDVIIDTFRY